jgi:uncharacterized protein (TIGR02145 family)
MARILFLMMFPFVCFSQITPREDIPVNNLLKEKENLDTKRKASYNLDEIKVRWKKAALENCPGVPCIVTPPPPPPPPPPSFTCGTSTVTDVDGNVYNTKLIGSSQCWTTTNLKVTKYNDGTPIPDLTLAGWSVITGARTGYVATGVTGVYVGTFGYLYNWYAVNDPRKLCPDGWHVPTDSDWNKLVISWHSGTTVADTTSTSTTQSITAGTALKSNVTNPSPPDNLGWNSGSPGTNTSGFTALPGGSRNFFGTFDFVSNDAFFWSATEYGGGNAWYRNLNFNNGIVDRRNNNKEFGFSVRCLRD